jgi:hypothetical protein
MPLRDDAYARAGGQCECNLRGCSHLGRCFGLLRGEWEIRRIDVAEPLVLSNVLAICEACDRYARGSAIGPLPGF